MAVVTTSTGTARPMMSVAEAAEALGVSTRTGYRCVEAGLWPATRVGRSLRINPAWVEEMRDRPVREWEDRG